MALTAIAALFAIGASALSWDNARAIDLAPRFHWPDETTIFFFAARVAAGGSLVAPEPRNVVAGNRIHPRTANVRPDGAIVPGGYLGLPLWYGLIGRVIGERAMLFVTPTLAALGLLAFAVIVGAFAGVRTAALATIILALAPPWWLFTATAVLPNVPFVALLLIGGAVLISRVRWIHWFLGGLAVGLALTIRTHEFLWAIALVGVVAWHQHVRWPHLLALGVGIVLPFIPILALQSAVYGSAFTTGYALLQDGGALPTEFAARGANPMRWVWTFIAPFGWEPTAAIARFSQYIILPYWWLATLAVVGMGAAARAHHRIEVIITLALSAWLVLLYGSWTIADPLVRASNVLTISYVRYWLPIVVLLAMWAAVGVRALLAAAPSRMRATVAVILVLGIAMASAPRTIDDPSEGIRAQRRDLAANRERARAVIAATTPDTIILSHRMDKVFFPERAVVFVPERPGEDATLRRDVTALVAVAPVAWYAASPPSFDGFSFDRVDGMPFGEQLFRVRATP